MIPLMYLPQSPQAAARQNDALLRQAITDINRLWSMVQAMQSDGLTIGNDPAADILPLPDFGGSGGSVRIREGVTTSALTAPTDGKVSPTTCTVEEWDAGASLAVTMPEMITTNTGITITNRDENLSLPSGTYVQWFEKTLADGSTENRLNYWSCP